MVILIIMIISIIAIWIFNIEGVNLLAIFILSISIYTIYKVRKNKYLLILNVVMLYFTYGIVVGEYLVGNKQPTFNDLRNFNNGQYYTIALVMLFIFILIYSIILNKKEYDEKFNIKFKSNNLIYLGLLVLLIYIGVFEINRSVGDSYKVAVTSVYEYSYILFLFIILYSGNDKIKKIIIYTIASIFIIQDFYYGGRVTSIQITLVIVTTLFIDKVNMKNLLIGIFFVVILMSAISIYRLSYSLQNINLSDIIANLKEDLFVDSTAVYAYGSSITHIAGKDYFSLQECITSMIGFIVNIFFGSNSKLAKMGNVTKLVYPIYTNIGGGIIFSHFYFWMGWFGVILIPALISLLINKLFQSKKEIHRLMIIGIIATVPRWYLYTPLILFRAVIIFIPIGYMILNKIDYMSKEVI